MLKYPHFALNNLFMANGYIETKMGEDVVHEYEREEELEQCIRRLVLRKPEPFRGWELRFLRRGLNLSQADFGNLVDRDAQTVARWEKTSEVVPRFVDLIIRARFAQKYEPNMTMAEVLSYSDGNAPALPTFIQLMLTEKGWVFDFEFRTRFTLSKAKMVEPMMLPIGLGPVQTLSERFVILNSVLPVIKETTGLYSSGSFIGNASDNSLSSFKYPLLKTRHTKSITTSGSVSVAMSERTMIQSRTLQ